MAPSRAFAAAAAAAADNTFDAPIDEYDVANVHEHSTDTGTATYSESIFDDRASTGSRVSDIEPSNVVIVTDVHPDIFLDSEEKAALEQSLAEYGRLLEPPAWLKSFSRVIFTFCTVEEALAAKHGLNYAIWHSTPIRAYLGDAVSPMQQHRTMSAERGADLLAPSPPVHNTQLLAPPINDKAFLISPPSSPPLGWRQACEKSPIIQAMDHLSLGPPEFDGSSAKSPDSLCGSATDLTGSSSNSSRHTSQYGGHRSNVADSGDKHYLGKSLWVPHRDGHGSDHHVSQQSIPSIILSDWDSSPSSAQQSPTLSDVVADRLTSALPMELAKTRLPPPPL